MDMIPLQAAVRDPKVSPKNVRRGGKVPAVVYGNEVKDLHIECEGIALHKAFVKAGESSLIELDVAGRKIPVLFKDLQFDPVAGTEVHVDFYAVNMKEEIDTTVQVRFTGESPAVVELQGVFVAAHPEVTVRCLPKNLPHDLPLDISVLKEFHTSLTVKDIPLPEGVVILDDAEAVVCTVQEPRKEEVIEAVSTEATPAEGAAAAPAEGAAAAEGEKKEEKK